MGYSWATVSQLAAKEIAKRMKLLRSFLSLWILGGLLASLVGCNLPAPVPQATPTATPLPAPSATPTPPPPPTVTPFPTSPPDPLKDAQRLLFYGDWEAALQAYQTAAQQGDPKTQARALVGQGRALLGARRYAQASAVLRQVAQQFPQETDAQADAAFFLARTYAALERWNDAAGAYQTYLRLRPGIIDAYIHEFRGDALFNAGDYAGAIQAYQAALQAPHPPERDYGLYLGIGRAYQQQQAYDQAIEVYRQLSLSVNEVYRLAYLDYLIGEAYLAKGDPQRAYAAFREAVTNYPSAYGAYLALVRLVEADQPVDDTQRGLVDYYAGQYGKAIEAFQRVLDAPGGAASAQALYYQGLALRALGRPEEALQVWRVLREGAPDQAHWDQAWEQSAYTLWAWLGRYQAATQLLVDFVNRAPNHPRAAEFLYDAALIQERVEHWAKAVALLEEVAARYPGTPYAYRALYRAGVLRYRMDDPAAALETFQRAAAFTAGPEELAAVYLWIGKAQQAAGDPRAARTAWQRAAAAAPTAYYSERARDLLAGRAPFQPPASYDLGVDWEGEYAQAAQWLIQTFAYPSSTDLRAPGALLNDPRVLRAAELWRLGRYPEARTELEALRNQAADDPATLLRLSKFALDLGAYRVAAFAARRVLDLAGFSETNNLAAPAYFSHVRFGPFFAPLIAPLAATYHFHPLFLLAVTRQESLFEPFVASSAGARGLMQIMPATGQEIAQQMGWPPEFTVEDLDRPKVSLTFGAYYLARQRDLLGGDLYAALAAYNGGPGNALRWQELAGEDPDLFLEMIAFSQTQDYIRRIYETFVIYRHLYAR